MRYLQEKSKISKINLDVKDKKILGILGSDARMPLTQISKRVGLSRDAVNYRINNYETKGIIQGYRTIVNMSALGYNNHHLFIKLNNPSQEVEQQIIKKLKNHAFIRVILKFSGNFDFEIGFVAKDINELDKRITQITEDCSGNLQDYEILTIPKSYFAEIFPPDFLKSNKPANIQKIKYKMDKKDIEILKFLSENARMALFEIAEKLKLSVDAVSYRIKNMKNSGIIVKFVPVMNYDALKYNLHAVLININCLDSKKENILEEFLLNNNHILWAVKTIGRFNVLIYFLVQNIEDLQNSISQLRSLFPKQINNYETLIAYEEYKYIYFPKELF
ncbi:MAG: Lrp/AsnC family transcriptional regulator [Candidatus Pacearchaeota archaeon]